jgi:hypothetical protein
VADLGVPLGARGGDEDDGGAWGLVRADLLEFEGEGPRGVVWVAGAVELEAAGVCACLCVVWEGG